MEFDLIARTAIAILAPCRELVGAIGFLAMVLLGASAPVRAAADTATGVAAGVLNTCAIIDTGGLKCWGWNASGKLGDGTSMDRDTPVDVVGLADGVIAVAPGGLHTCALTDAGGVKCWGDNRVGQLGDGTTTNRSTPVDVLGLSQGVIAVAAGSSHTCALTDLGGVKCWGWNANGQLGDGTTASRGIPQDVVGLITGVAAISAGGAHSCALTHSGGLECWGFNRFGQLGNGMTGEAFPIPSDVIGLRDGATAVAAGGRHTCAIANDGGVQCWGANLDGQLGDGTATDRSAPVDVSDLTSGVTAVAAGGSHTCAIDSVGSLRCWGSNRFGELGDGTANRIPGGVTAVAAGDQHTCAITDFGLWCWGSSAFGQLGDDRSRTSMKPVDVSGLGGVGTAIAVGDQHACALTDAGGLQCWGDNFYGQLGNGGWVDPYSTPLKLPRFRRHLHTWERRGHDAEESAAEGSAAVPAGVPAADGGVGALGAKP